MNENRKFLCKSCFRMLLNLLVLILLTGCGNMFGGQPKEDEINNPPPNEEARSDNANLSSLAVSGNISMSFDSNTLEYSATVSYDTTEIEVTPTAESEKASIIVNGNSVFSGSASETIALSVGENTVTIVVTAEDGRTSKTYTITVTRLDQTAVEYRYGSAQYGAAYFH